MTQNDLESRLNLSDVYASGPLVDKKQMAPAYGEYRIDMSHQATHFSAIVPGLPLFWKPGSVGGIRLRSGKGPKISERSGNMCIQGNLIVAALQNKLPILYSHCISFFVRDHRRLWINKCAFVQHIAWKESGKSCLFFSVWRVVTL